MATWVEASIDADEEFVELQSNKFVGGVAIFCAHWTSRVWVLDGSVMVGNATDGVGIGLSGVLEEYLRLQNRMVIRTWSKSDNPG